MGAIAVSKKEEEQIERLRKDLRIASKSALIRTALKTLEKKSQVILNRTQESDQELINLIVMYGDIQDKLIVLLKPAMKKAQEIIEMIKQEYHLK